MYDKLKKTVSSALIIIFLFQTTLAGAFNPQQKHDEEFLTSLNLLPENTAEYIDRYTLLYTFVQIEKYDYSKYTSGEPYSIFADISIDAPEYKMAHFAVDYGLFKGKEIKDGKIVADLASPATWREALIIALRSLNSSPESTEDMFFWAKIHGLDKFYVNTNNTQVKLTDALDEKVNYADFCSFANKVLHTPYTRTSYSGDFTAYHIDKFISTNNSD